MNKFIDHKGNEFNTLQELCKFNDVDVKSFVKRAKQGYSIEECIKGKIKAVDHLGNTYNSISAMCKAHNVEFHKYYNRIQIGWTVEEALTGRHKKASRKIEVVDFQGIKHASSLDMANYYGVNYNTFRQRVLRGMTEEEALTYQNGKYNKKCVDHLNNEYENTYKMCEHYNVLPATYLQRLKKGYCLKDALLGKKPIFDHLGNKYKNIQEMCNAYSVKKDAFFARRRYGWSLEEALTIPLNTKLKHKKEKLGII